MNGEFIHIDVQNEVGRRVIGSIALLLIEKKYGFAYCTTIYREEVDRH